MWGDWIASHVGIRSPRALSVQAHAEVMWSSAGGNTVPLADMLVEEVCAHNL